MHAALVARWHLRREYQDRANAAPQTEQVLAVLSEPDLVKSKDVFTACPRAFLQRMLRDLKDAHGRPKDAGRRLVVVQYLR